MEKQKISISIIVLLQAISVLHIHAQQNYGIPMDQYGKSHSFSMGHFPKDLYIASLNIQLDSNYQANIARKGMNFHLTDPYIAYLEKKDHRNASGFINLDSTGNLQSDSRVYVQKEKLKVSAHYWDRKYVFGRLLTLGNMHLPVSHAKKIKWMDLDLSRGRITDFQNYENLKLINSTSIYDQRSYETKSHYFAGAALNYYPGDPFFWKSVRQVPLQGLAINLDISHFDSRLGGSNGNIYFLDEGISELIATKKIKTLNIEHIPYFPVNFQDFKSIDHLTIGTLMGPEQVNLALVMRSFKKDNYGSWSIYFPAIDTNISVEIPFNGTYASHYKNGQAICRGSYMEGKPDGKWEFWYDNGQICEERHYKNGQKKGNWVFFTPEGDTVTEFRYQDNLLVYRKDIGKENLSACGRWDNNHNVKTTSEYHLAWKSENEVVIDRQLYSIILPTLRQNYKIGDTMKNVLETWSFGGDDWEYLYTDHCIDQTESNQLHLKGKLGEVPYFSKTTTILHEKHNEKFPKAHYNHTARDWTIDFKNCYWEYHQYSNQNKENEFRLEKTDKQNILPSEGLCK